MFPWSRHCPTLPHHLGSSYFPGRSPSPRQRSPSSVRQAQNQFIAVLLVTIALVAGVEFFYWPTAARLGAEPRPRAIQPTFFYTAEVGDERRLGNAMFALASLVGIVRHNNATAVVPSRCRIASLFALRGVARSADMLNTMGVGGATPVEEYGRRGGAYDRSMLRLHERRSHILLKGYFQSYRYFDAVQADVRKNFEFNDNVRAEADRYFREEAGEFPGGDYVRVGIHVRRGDMTEPFYRNYGYEVAPADYFHKAMQYFRTRHSNVVFIVCSDDLEWSRKNLGTLGVLYSEGRSDAVDLAILAACDHVIVSVGSFGWWAAWLANGTTVYYGKWPRQFTQLEYQVEKRDYFPAHWIPLH